MNNKAIGLIETKGLAGAIEALDACLKAANVTLVSKEKSTGGLITITVTGDVGSVKAAIDAGSLAARRIGTVVSAHVIPRLSEEVFKMISPEPISHNAAQPHEEAESETHIEVSVLPEHIEASAIQAKQAENYDLNALDRYKVVELRHIARILDLAAIDRSKIKFANKEQLIEAILAHLKGGNRDSI